MTVHDNTLMERFETTVDGQVAYAAYRMEGQVIVFTHTVVPEAIGGRGVATDLVRAGLASARERGLQVTPRCPVFRAFMKRHADTHDLLSPEGHQLVGD
jgi:predicted GNAT family acetyltransferase